MAGFFNFIKKPDDNATSTISNGVAPQNIPPGQTTPPVPTITPVAASTQNKPISSVVPSLSPTPVQNAVSAVISHQPVSTDQNQKEQLDLMTHLTQRSNKVFMAAQTKAKELGNQLIDTEHILHGLLTDNEIYTLFTELKVNPPQVETELGLLYRHEKSTVLPQISPRVKRVLDNSLIVARKLGYEFISPEHILLAVYEEGEGLAARVLAKLGVKKEELNKKIVGKREGLEGAQQTSKKRSALQEYTIDLTAKAAQGELDPVVERSDVIERVVHILSRRTKNNPALVGEAGVGKTAIIEGLAQRIVTKQVPETLLNKKILQLDLMGILAGASHRGEFEERVKNLIEEVQNSKGNIIMFIDEIHNIVGAGSSGEGSMDISNFLKPALSRGEIQLIGATTITEYRKYIEKDPALERRFQPIMVPEPTEAQAVKMLKAIKGKYEAFHRVQIPDQVVEDAVVLSKRYVGDRFLPDKAVDLIDEAASAVRLPLISLPEEIKSQEETIAQLQQELKESEKKNDGVKARILRSKIDDQNSQLKEKQEAYALKKAQTTTAVSPETIKDIISRWTGIPVSKITSSEMDRLAHLEDIMHKRLIGQEAAVKSVAAAVRRGRAGLKSTQRPIGSFIFMGPTGVGKTELAKTLADILFGQEEAMIRFDMTEYMEKHEVAKLLGAPPGYIGYEEGGKLTEAVRRKPYSVVLFDEVEKAHPDIFNILLQILDDGRLTDNKGHTVSFKNTVVICTSNIGTKLIQDALLNKDLQNADDQKKKAAFETVKKQALEELRKFFRPELINRFDEMIVFEPLTIENMIKIAGLQLKALSRLLEDQNMGFAYTDAVTKEIVNTGFDPIYGARPLRRAIQKMIEDPLSGLIIEQKLKPGDTVSLDFDGNDITFHVETAQFINTVKKAVIKSFLCQPSGKAFTTIVVQNATVICPFNITEKVVTAPEPPPVIQPEKQEAVKPQAIPPVPAPGDGTQMMPVQNNH